MTSQLYATSTGDIVDTPCACEARAERVARAQSRFYGAVTLLALALAATYIVSIFSRTAA